MSSSVCAKNQRWETLVDVAVMVYDGIINLDDHISDHAEIGKHDSATLKRRLTNNNELQTKVDCNQVSQGPMAKRRRINLVCNGGEVLVIQKKLFPTDVDPNQCRLSIPYKQIEERFFSKLYPSEVARLDSDGIPITVLEPHGQEHAMVLKNWKSNKMYALVGGWKHVCCRNGLEADKTIQLWCFRRNHVDLCFRIIEL